jgi:hypothetical protein
MAAVHDEWGRRSVTIVNDKNGRGSLVKTSPKSIFERPNITTTLPSTGDPVYCIRAGRIDDVGLMSDTTIEQMVDFFIYCKEVNSAVADLRSIKADVLVKLITLVGGSRDLRKSLSAASKKANELYPTFNGRINLSCWVSWPSYSHHYSLKL